MPYDRERHGPHRVVGPGFQGRVFALVRQVPPGAVTTYGDLGAALGLRSVARQVGFALAALKPAQDDVTWHRVVNSSGTISFPVGSSRHREQRRRLRAEGVEVDRQGHIGAFAAIRFDLGGTPDGEPSIGTSQERRGGARSSSTNAAKRSARQT